MFRVFALLAVAGANLVIVTVATSTITGSAFAATGAEPGSNPNNKQGQCVT